VAVRPIRIYPDPILKRAALSVGAVDADALALARDLVDTMRAHDRCVGLAANQIGILRRCIVVDVTGHPKEPDDASGLIVLFDPVVVSSSGKEVGREGCLSVPELTANVARATLVTVRGLGEDGAERPVRARDFEARALQHEIDHLDGILFLDRVASLETDVFRRRR
jgi:peptide deformylase